MNLQYLLYNKYMIKINIIPLGQNCLPRTLLTRWKIKPRKILGELTFPFDLAVFETREITNLIKTDFEEFFYNLNYRDDEGFWVKEPDLIKFVHDKNFKNKDKEKLINKYLERIENFRRIIKEPNLILFIQLLGDCSDCDNLYIELKKIRGDKPFILAIIDTQNIVNTHNSEIKILKLHFPSEEYKQHWWEKKYYNSKEGIEFEKQIADFCVKLIENSRE